MKSTIRVLDTHTAGEPTRVVIAGGPDLGTGPLSQRRELFRTDFDHYRSAIVNEPRGSDVMVGAILVEPTDPTCCAGVIFFNNVGYLGMCGHGVMGVVAALGHLGKIKAGMHWIETPVGVVTVQYDGKHRVSVENVPSYRYQKDVAVNPLGARDFVIGDIAWGGNWFFLVERGNPPQHDYLEHAFVRENANSFVRFTEKIRQKLEWKGITAEKGSYIDHIELIGPPSDPRNQSRNFVLCPGGAYDRSPCGTGTSAKLACLAADGKLQPGEIWRQESILGSVFEASYRCNEDQTAVIPTITGSAYVTGESQLIIDCDDPFAWGIRAPS